MALTPGTRLGPYEVIAQIGAGGMGKVYRATDTNLKRAVAIKVLPAAVAADPERLARFQREAEVLASLNHPNIAAIYGLQPSDGTIALVMELVEGETLREWFRHALPLERGLGIARQVLEAVGAAHRKGVVHRDLKPENVMVRADGYVKVLDFGLAKWLPSAAQLDTVRTTMNVSHHGQLLGTFPTCRRSRSKGTRLTGGATCSRSESCCMKY